MGRPARGGGDPLGGPGGIVGRKGRLGRSGVVDPRAVPPAGVAWSIGRLEIYDRRRPPGRADRIGAAAGAVEGRSGNSRRPIGPGMDGHMVGLPATAGPSCPAARRPAVARPAAGRTPRGSPRPGVVGRASAGTRRRPRRWRLLVGLSTSTAVTSRCGRHATADLDVPIGDRLVASKIRMGSATARSPPATSGPRTGSDSGLERPHVGHDAGVGRTRVGPASRTTYTRSSHLDEKVGRQGCRRSGLRVADDLVVDAAPGDSPARDPCRGTGCGRTCPAGYHGGPSVAGRVRCWSRPGRGRRGR